VAASPGGFKLHIPDGYLSPQTYVPLWGVSLAFWSVSLKKVKKEVSTRQVPYLGLGPSAHSFDRRSRQWNVSDVKKYIKSVNSGEVSFEREELDRLTIFNEYVMTSLRTMWGIDLAHVEEFYDKELHDYLVNLSDKYIRYGLMRREKNTLVLTDQGTMISDNIIAELLTEL